MTKLSDYRERSAQEIESYLARHTVFLSLLPPEATSSELKAVHLEEQILLNVKPDNHSQSHLLICAADTGGFNAVRPLIAEALSDPRVRAVSLNLWGAALKAYFESELHYEFSRINP